MKRSTWVSILRPVFAVILGLALGLICTRFTGESPVKVLRVLWMGAFGTLYDFGMTLFYTTPLIFTGLSVAFAFRAGLFNIGAEGQLILGALAAAACGIYFPNIPWPFAPALASVCAFAAGGIWGFIPGWLRARRGSHEVITTIMMNFIAAGFASWVTLYLLRTQDSQNSETMPVGTGYLLSQFAIFQGAPVSWALPIALVAVALTGWFLSRTAFGFELRASGKNPVAAGFSGIESAKVRIFAMTIAGGLAGCVGLAEVLGAHGRFKMDFSPGFGFTGIAVALLGRGHPVGVLAGALLFGALHKGSLDLDMETQTMTREISSVLQAWVILSVSADGLWDWMNRKRGSQ